jgi:putative ABC transport system permease protein
VTLPGLAAKNILRNKVRTVLTVLGVSVAIITFLLLRTMVYAWTAAADYATKDRIVTRHKITFIMPLPKKYVDDVRNTPGVKSATWANWFGGKDPAHENEFFGTMAIDPKSFFEVVDELSVPADQKQAFIEDKTGAIVGEVLARKMKWSVGQKVTLQSGIYGEGDWTFTVRGIYTALRKSIDNSTFFFHWDYLNERAPAYMKDNVGWIWSRVGDAKAAADTSVVIDKMFDERDTQTLSQDERSFNASFFAMMSAVLGAIDVISLVILVIMLLILGNTIAMGVRERTFEYGVLRAIGFKPGHIAMFVILESMMIALIGGGLGILLSYPLVEKGIGGFIEENMGSIIPYFRMDPRMTVAAAVLAIALGGVAAVIPAVRASRIHVVDALRRVA